MTTASTLDTDSVTPLLNMLNMKWVILSDGNIALRNTHANGNAWFVDRLRFVPNADAEIAALKGLDTKTAAVADARFKAQLDGSPLGTGTAQLSHYAPNELHYTVQTDKGGVLVLSEIYYPGWTATLDGQPIEIGRVNYVLRALRIPAGRHELRLEFRPTSVATTDAIAYAALALLALALAFALWRTWQQARISKN